MADATPIVRDLDPAPSTKRAMLRRERDLRGAEEIFRMPSHPGKPTRF